MSLEEYRRKRQFSETPEPEPAAGATGSERKRTTDRAAGRRFVIHKHGATHLHFDLRLEHAGVLKSWAVPRGPSIDPSRRRLAVATEDHPATYLDFEGVIPEGNYGAGPMLIWDRGYWSCDGSIDEGLRQGRLKIRLTGERLDGRWTLVRRGGADSKQWLLIREQSDRPLSMDSASDVASKEPVITQRSSVVSGLTLEQMRNAPNGRERKPRSGRQSRWTAAKGPDLSPELSSLPDIQPMLPTLVEDPPEGEQWIHELKLDGYRMQMRLAAGRVQLLTRNGIDWTERLPELADAATALSVDSAIVDCELAALAKDGSTDFASLQSAFRERRTQRLIMFLFDLMFLNGDPLIHLPLLERKRRLAPLVRQAKSQRLQYLDHIEGSPHDLLRECRARGLEGIVSKRNDKPYREGRSRLWLKVKSRRRDRFVIGGYERSTDAVAGLGALAIGFFDTKGRFIYCGKVGGGWSRRDGESLLQRLQSDPRDAPAFVDTPPAMQWVEPRVVVEISFTNVTPEGRLRHPTLVLVQPELPPEIATRDRVSVDVAEGDFAPPEEDAGSQPTNVRKSKPRSRLTPEVASVVQDLKISNPNRVLYPQGGITKADVVRYLVQVSHWMLPHLDGRIVSLVRCPQGIEGERFFQRHHRLGLAAALKPVAIDGESTPMLTIDSVEGLVAAAQMNGIELHPWSCRLDRIDRPDRIIFDLDPDSSVAWSQIVDAAWLVRDAIGGRGLDSFVKTTGSKGLHVVVPIARRYSWNDVAAWCEDLARQLASSNPKRLTAHMSKEARRGKIYLDHLRNRQGATAVAAYSLRTQPHAPVSVPIGWEELSGIYGSNQWTLTSLPDRLRSLTSDPWKGMVKNHQRLK